MHMRQIMLRREAFPLFCALLNQACDETDGVRRLAGGHRRDILLPLSEEVLYGRGEGVSGHFLFFEDD